MLYIIDNHIDPYWNLAAEEYLLKHITEPVFRLWSNTDSIIIGQYQNALAEIDLDYLKQLREKNPSVNNRRSDVYQISKYE